MNKKIITITLTGAAGNIGSSLIFQLLQPGLLSPDPYSVHLKLSELPEKLPRLRGLVMEMEDSFNKTLEKAEIFEDCVDAFKDADLIILCGARPRKIGMERKDLLGINAKIVEKQAKLINETVKPSTRILVVCNPSNTNALIFKKIATKTKPSQVTSLSLLDLKRAERLLERTAVKEPGSVNRVRIYGNHSKNMLIDINQAYFDIKEEDGKRRLPVKETVDKEFIEGDLQRIVQERGHEIIKTLGCSASYSAAYAICKHVRAWFRGCEKVMAVGVIVENFMDSEMELCVTLPVVVKEGVFEIIDDPLEGVEESGKERIRKNLKELIQEKKIAFSQLIDN